jgi:hypothetical protein
VLAAVIAVLEAEGATAAAAAPPLPSSVASPTIYPIVQKLRYIMIF